MLNLEPQFFDFFGFIAFVYIAIVGLLKVRGDSLPLGAFKILLVIGIIGIIIDGIIIFTYYFH